MRVAHQIGYPALLALRRTVSALPEGARSALGSFAGAAMGFFMRGRLKVVEENIRKSFPKMDREAVRATRRECFDNIGRVAVEFLSVPALTKERILELVRFENEEILKNALAGGKGALLLTCHQGNWEYTNLALAARGYNMNVVGRSLKDRRLDSFVAKTREHFGSKFIPHRNAVRPILRALAEGGVAGFLLDQRAQAKEGILSEFFGRPVSTNPGLALIALRSGAPVVFCWTERVKGGFVVRFEGVIPPPEPGDRDEMVKKFTREFDRWMESAVRKKPGQWFWVHRRWRVPKELLK